MNPISGRLSRGVCGDCGSECACDNGAKMAYYRTIMQPQTPPLRNPGDVVNGRYAIAQIIGKGATSEVFVASDREKDGKLVALKYLKLDPDYKPALLHFKSEFETMTHLKHPHIAEVYDFEWDDDREYFFFTSELLDGFDFVNSSKGLDVEQIELLLIQTLRALEYLHGHGIFHFDIKPQNVFVLDAKGPSPSVKVIDFGLAATRPPDRVVGTPSYMAPEVIQHNRPDGRADLYALGVLAYYALTGINPFKSKDKQETLKNHLTLTPAAPVNIAPSVPEYLSSIVMKLIEKDPEHRYALPSDVIHDINFRSPRFYAIETPETLLSYVPREGPFVGRKGEIAAFKEHLSAAESSGGSASLFWIRGDAGCGKSRLAEECKKTAQLMNYSTASGGEIDHKFLKRLERLKRPSVVILDGFDRALARADSVPVGALQNLLNNANAVITSSNGEDALARIKDFFAKVNIKEFRTIDLHDFSIPELREYIRTLTGLIEAPSWLLNSLHTATGGNPLFLTESMKELISRGLLFDKGGRWKKSTMEDLRVDFSNLGVPTTVIERVAEKFRRLTKEEKEVSDFLSVWSGWAEEETISAILGRAAKKELNNLTAQGLLIYDPNLKQYVFTNIVTKRAKYLGLAAEDRRRWHDRISARLTAKGIKDRAAIYHLQRASDAAAARKALLDEITNIEDEIPPLHAIDEFLDRFGDAMDEDVFNVTLLKARHQISGRNYDSAHATYAALLEHLPDRKLFPEWHARTHIALASLLKKERRLTEAAAALKKAKKLAALMKKNPATAITIENHLAEIDLMTNNYDAAIRKYGRSRRAAKKLGRDDALKVTNNDLGYAYFYKGDYDAAARVLKDDVKFYKKAGRRRRLCRALYLLGEAYRLQQKYDRAEGLFNEAGRIAKEANDTVSLFRAYNGMGSVLREEGAWDDSTGYFERALDLAIHAGDYDAAASCMVNAACNSSNLGNQRKAEDAFETALYFLNRDGFPVRMRALYLCRTHLELGEMMREQKKFDTASDHLEKALALAKKPEANVYLFWVLLTQAKLAKDMHRGKRAAGIIKKAKKLADSAQKKRLASEV